MKKDRILFLFYGMFCYEINRILPLFNIPLFILTFISLLGASLFIGTLLFIKKRPRIDKTTYILILLFLLWQIVIYIQGWPMGNYYVDSLGEMQTDLYLQIRAHLMDSHYLLPFLFPFICLFDYDLKIILKISRLYQLITLISLLFFVYYFGEIFSVSHLNYTDIFSKGSFVTIRSLVNTIFIAPVMLFMMISYNLKYKFIKGSVFFTRILPVVLLVFYVLAQIRGGGRGGTLTSVYYLIIICLVYLLTKSKKTKIIFFLLIALMLYGIIVFSYQLGLFDLLMKRFSDGDVTNVSDNNRTILLFNYIKDFNRTPIDWIMGRGINATYYNPGTSLPVHRNTIEYGFLFYILRGGIINLLLYISILVTVSYKSFYKSSNSFCKISSFFLVWQIPYLFIFGVPTIGLGSLFLWLVISLVSNDKIRKLSDAEVMKLLIG